MLFLYNYIFIFIDTDECAFRENDCHRDAVCINTVGSYSCKCRTGFEDYKDGRLCLKEEDQGNTVTQHF